MTKIIHYTTDDQFEHIDYYKVFRKMNIDAENDILFFLCVSIFYMLYIFIVFSICYTII